MAAAMLFLVMCAIDFVEQVFIYLVICLFIECRVATFKARSEPVTKDKLSLG